MKALKRAMSALCAAAMLAGGILTGSSATVSLDACAEPETQNVVKIYPGMNVENNNIVVSSDDILNFTSSTYIVNDTYESWEGKDVFSGQYSITQSGFMEVCYQRKNVWSINMERLSSESNEDDGKYITYNSSDFEYLTGRCSPYNLITGFKIVSGKGTNSEPYHTIPLLGSFAAIEIYGVGMSLNDEVGLKFCIEDTSKIDSITVEGPNGSIEDSYDEAVEAAEMSGDDFFSYCYGLYPNQCKEDVTIKAYDKNGDLIPMMMKYGPQTNSSEIQGQFYYDLDVYKDGYSCNIDKYLDYCEQTYGDDLTNSESNLVRATGNYCHAAYNYAENGSYDVESRLASYKVEPDMLKSYAPNFTSDEAKLSVVLGEKNDVRLYIEGMDGKTRGRIRYGDSTVDYDAPPHTGRRGSYFENYGIKASELMDNATITYNDKDYTFSPMSYVYRVLNTSDDSKLITLSKAFYLYAKYAKELKQN